MAMRDVWFKRPSYLELVFITLFALFFLSIVASLARWSVQSDTLLIGLATLFVLYSIAMPFVTHPENIKYLKVSASGVEILKYDTQKVKAAALDKEKRERASLKLISTADKPSRSPWDYAEESVEQTMREIQLREKSQPEVFLQITCVIDDNIRTVAKKTELSYEDIRTLPVPHLTFKLMGTKLIKEDTYELITQLWAIRNKAVSSPERLTDSAANDAIYVGKVILTDLHSRAEFY
jgi:hypothetical protein